MKREDFITSSTTIRVREKKLLNKKQFLNLSESADFEEAVSLLKDSPYGDELEKLEKKEAYDEVLANHLKKTYGMISNMKNGEEVLKYARLKYEAHNLKVLVKEYILNTDFSSILSPLADTQVSKIRLLLKEGNYNPNEYENPSEKAVAKVMANYEENKDPQNIDIMLDKFRLEESLKLAEEFGLPYFETLSVGEIDISNVKTLLRSKNQDKDLSFVREALVDGGTISKETLLEMYNDSMESILEVLSRKGFSSSLSEGIDEYKKAGNLQGVEKALDDFRMEMIKEAKKITYGPEILYGYIMAKENEIKNIRIALVSKLNGIPSDEIQGRLRENYV